MLFCIKMYWKVSSSCWVFFGKDFSLGTLFVLTEPTELAEHTLTFLWFSVAYTNVWAAVYYISWYFSCSAVVFFRLISVGLKIYRQTSKPYNKRAMIWPMWQNCLVRDHHSLEDLLFGKMCRPAWSYSLFVFGTGSWNDCVVEKWFSLTLSMALCSSNVQDLWAKNHPTVYVRTFKSSYLCSTHALVHPPTQPARYTIAGHLLFSQLFPCSPYFCLYHLFSFPTLSLSHTWFLSLPKPIHVMSTPLQWAVSFFKDILMGRDNLGRRLYVVPPPLPIFAW